MCAALYPVDLAVICTIELALKKTRYQLWAWPVVARLCHSGADVRLKQIVELGEAHKHGEHHHQQCHIAPAVA
jgi:hypothetical protein